MRISKVAAAVTLSTGLLMGCNPEVINENSREGNSGGSTPPSPLAGMNWEIGNSDGGSNVATQSGGVNLPNIYTFSGTTQKYYDDDQDPGTYEITTSTFSEQDGKLTFTYYGDVASGEPITDATYSVENGQLFIVREGDTDLSGQDQSDYSGVKEAIAAANEASGDNQSVAIRDTLSTDTGELRLQLSEINKGKLTLDVIYQIDTDSEQVGGSNGSNAYISIYTSSASKANLFGEIILAPGETDDAPGEIRFRTSANKSAKKFWVTSPKVKSYR